MHDWWTCEGGPVGRRALFSGTLGWLIGGNALAQVAFAKQESERDTLVTIFLRGGADGLNLVAPYMEDAYYRRRPSLAIPSPGKKSGSAPLLDLDGFFGLHPSLTPLLEHFREGELGIVHAVGSNDHTRSHFEAMNTVERGLPDLRQGAASGWIARYLAKSEPVSNSPLRAVAFGSTMPDVLRGGNTAVSLNSLAEFGLHVPTGSSTAAYQAVLADLYAYGKDAISQAGRETLDVLSTLKRLDPSHYQPSAGVQYPNSDLGKGLKDVAFLIKNEVGLEVACLDKGGWDTHVAQGSTSGWMASLADDLAQSIAAFLKDLGSLKRRTTVIVLTEFGRRAYENTGLGTDHGRASVMFVFGKGVGGGEVHAKWPGLEDHQLDEEEDLRVTTDYRTVLASVLERAMRFSDAASLFPGLRA